jgi:hypothetical protein
MSKLLVAVGKTQQQQQQQQWQHKMCLDASLDTQAYMSRACYGSCNMSAATGAGEGTAGWCQLALVCQARCSL